MAKFKYTCIDKNFDLVKGIIECENLSIAQSILKSKDFSIISVKRSYLSENFSFSKGKITNKELSTFCRNLFYIIDSGIDLKRALDIMSKQIKNEPLHSSILKINKIISNGQSLSIALKSQSFPDFLVNLVYIGENSGTLDFVLDKLANYYENKSNLNAKTKNMLIYPIIVVSLMIIVTIFALVFIIPNYMQIFNDSNAKLPLPTLILIGISSFLKQNFIIIFIFIVFTLTTIFFIYSTKKGRLFFDKLFLKLPVINTFIIKSMNYYFAEIFSILINAGVNLIDALDMIKNLSNNTYIKNIFKILIKNVKEGNSIGSSMEVFEVFEPMLFTMVSTGEESGKLSQIMVNTSNYFKKDLENLAFRIEKIIEISITLILGIILGFIMLGIMLPTFSLANTL